MKLTPIVIRFGQKWTAVSKICVSSKVHGKVDCAVLFEAHDILLNIE
jgi:hypothetical protein